MPEDAGEAGGRGGQEAQEEAEAAPKWTYAVKIGRNAPCPCGSGKKFKRCCIGRV